MPAKKKVSSAIHAASGFRRLAVVSWQDGPPHMRVSPGVENPPEQKPRHSYVALRKPRASKFGRPRRVGPPGATNLIVDAAEGRPMAVAAWVTAAGDIEAVTWTPSHGWGATATVDESSLVNGMDLVVGSDGSSVISWRSLEGSLPGAATDGRGTGLFRSFNPTDGWGAVQAFEAPGLRGPYWSVAVRRNGIARIAWSGACSPTDPGARNPVAVIEVRGDRMSQPQLVPNSKCPVYYATRK